MSKILTQDLDMKDVLAKFIPQLLLPEQKEHHAAAANSLIQIATNKPHLAPCDIWLFSKVKSPLKGKRFQTVDAIRENTMGHLMAIPTKDFAQWF